MKLEQLPLIAGVIIVLLGLVLLWDALQPDGTAPTRERRRRMRAARSRPGEALAGLGMAALGAALAGRDEWKYGTIAVLSGALLMLAGTALNWRYFREFLLFRGAERRGEKRHDPTRPPDGPMRIR